MNYPLDVPIKIEKEDVERDNIANIPKPLFDVEIKVEKEVLPEDESDWCIDSHGDLLEPLFFKPVSEQSAQKCAFCNVYFTDVMSVLQHNLVHLNVVICNPKLFQCDCCSSYFTGRHHIKQHISVHKSNIVYELKLSKQKYEKPSKTQYLKYKPKAYIPINNNTKTDCYKYVKIYGSKPKRLKDGLTNSLQYKPKACKPEPKTKQLYKCNVCNNNKTYTYKRWHGHMSTVHGDGGYFCGICKLEFKCEQYFMRHMTKKHNKKFAPQKRMPERKPVVKGSDRVSIKCDECDAVLLCRNALKTHKRNVHSEEKHVCSICDSTLKCKSYLLAHMRRVHYDDGKLHFCECGKKFRSPRYLSIHKKNAHSKKK